MYPTMTAKTADLLPYILPIAPTVPLPYAEFQARLATIEFCERTRCWRQIITTSLSNKGRAIIASPNSTIHEFEEASLDGVDLIPSQFTEAEPEEVTGRQNKGQARYITQVNPGEVAVFPVQQGKLRVSCFLKPRHGQDIGVNQANPLEDSFNALPAFMITQYASALASGALERILGTPKQDFTDLKMAAYHRSLFEAACNSHFSANMRGQQRAPMRVKPRWM